VALVLSPLQGTHVLVARLHVGLVPLQAVAFVAEHAAHAPLARHAGWAADWQALVAPEPLSPLQVAQVFVAVLQVGTAPVQAVVFVLVH
jgi:hypothetical protein